MLGPRCYGWTKSKRSGARLTPKLLERASTDTNQYDDIELLLKARLSLQRLILSWMPGVERNAIRVKWWDETAQTFADAYLGPEREELLQKYLRTAPSKTWEMRLSSVLWPLLDGEPKYLKANVACVDFSVAREGGKLVAYRWDGEALSTIISLWEWLVEISSTIWHSLNCFKIEKNLVIVSSTKQPPMGYFGVHV